MIKKVWKENRFYLISFFICAILESFKDVMEFRVLRDSGFFSIHTDGSLDGWHLFKWIIQFIIAINFIRWSLVNHIRYFVYILIAYLLIAVVPHEFILHQLY